MTSRYTKRINVVDVEATCWEEAQTSDTAEKQISEIIEIGLVQVDLTTMITDPGFAMPKAYGQLITPEHSEVSDFCTKLTTITPEMVDKKDPGVVRFPAAALSMEKEYRTDLHPWASWGDYDRKQFEKNCELYGCAYPFGRTHLNVKNLFSLITGDKECSVEMALNKLGMPFQGTPHRALDDAQEIAKILMHLLRTAHVGLRTWAEYAGARI